MSAVKFLLFALLIFTAQLAPAQPAVDASTMNHKLLMGYQGWFACPGDGSLPNYWVHWFRKNNPVATNATVDLWPDVSELDADEPSGSFMPVENNSSASSSETSGQKSTVALVATGLLLRNQCTQRFGGEPSPGQANQP